MKILVRPNFVIPGYEGMEYLEFPKEEVNLRTVLEELVKNSKGRIWFIKNGFVSEEDYTIAINNRYLDGEKKDLDEVLHDGDIISIFWSALIGG